MTVAEKIAAIGENCGKLYGAGMDFICAAISQPAGIFYKAAFPANQSLTLKLPNTGADLREMIRLTTGLRQLNLILPTGQDYRLGYFAYSSADLQILQLPEGVQVADMANFVSRCSLLEEIRGQLDLSNCTAADNAFTMCDSLREVRFAPQTISLSLSFKQSQLLSAASVASVLEGLATVETTQTLTFHQTVKDTLTEAQKAALQAKNWTLG